MDVLIKIDKMCREHSIQFYCADTWGFYGYSFLDLQKHKCTRYISDMLIQDFKQIGSYFEIMCRNLFYI